MELLVHERGAVKSGPRCHAVLIPQDIADQSRIGVADIQGVYADARAGKVAVQRDVRQLPNPFRKDASQTILMADCRL